MVHCGLLKGGMVRLNVGVIDRHNMGEHVHSRTPFHGIEGPYRPNTALQQMQDVFVPTAPLSRPAGHFHRRFGRSWTSYPHFGFATLQSLQHLRSF